MRRALKLVWMILFLIVFVPSASFGRFLPSKKDKSLRDLQRVFVITGANVHNVGELQMHVGNWGIFGSYPNSILPFAQAPSAQWPAGSGIEYLYVAGIWVGAMKSGVPAVSTAAYWWEFRPTQDPLDIIYRASEGDRGGNRLPSPTADDDNDGSIDEDFLDGHDNDDDGLIDEDFAAVSKQMFSCWYTDDQPAAVQIYPEHNPLHLFVRQESYQWEEDRYDDFVGIEYHITNIGSDVLENVYIGFFADCDAGPRDKENYWEDDATGHAAPPARCTDLGPVAVDIAYTYDVDGDEGKTLGYFGVMFLGHTIDPTGENAPQRVGISTYANFSGRQSYEEGGDPTNDFERYELLSKQSIERDATAPRDYRMLVSAGPFKELLPESTLIFQVAFVAGKGRSGIISNGINAQLTFEGAWFNLDGNRFTGVDGRETPVYGPAENVVVDSCREELRNPIALVPKGSVVWINNDCMREEYYKERCGYSDADSAKFRTGIAGKEAQIYWIVGTAPPPPKMRIDCCDKEGIAIYWDNFSETVPDVKTQIFDFEGYRLWRADNWTRPIGSSIENGPAHELWKLIFEADLINNFREDTGLDRYRYEPLNFILEPSQKRDFIEYMKEFMIEFPVDEPPCPQGVTAEVCDTLKALARWELGIEGGRQYYRYIDRSTHLGRHYFYSVTAMDHGFEEDGSLKEGKAGDPSSNFVYTEGQTHSQHPWAYKASEVYVVPNPATTKTMQPWTLNPTDEDPTGIKVEFRNLPESKGMIRIYSLAGDLVKELPFDGRGGCGTIKWDLVTRNGQDVTSGIYIFSIESEEKGFKRNIGKFVVIR